MRMRIRGRPIESDMAHGKFFCSFVARIFVAQSMEEAFAASCPTAPATDMLSTAPMW